LFATTNGKYFALFEVPERGTPFRIDTRSQRTNQIPRELISSILPISKNSTVTDEVYGRK